MLKGKLAVLVLVGLFVVTMMVSNGTANAGIIDPCTSYWQLHLVVDPIVPPIGGTWTGYCPLFACPQGDTNSFLTQGWWIWICVLDINEVGVPNVPASDFWMNDCDPVNDAILCGGSASSGADSLTNAAGMTTMTNGGMTAGGCSYGLSLVIQGFVVKDSVGGCLLDDCKDIALTTPGFDNNLEIDIVDLSAFAFEFPPNVAVIPSCADYNQDSLVDIIDLSLFAFHFGPPGHKC